MLELFLCSLVTIFPDYLYRRYAQGKRIGREINRFSVWFELRCGFISCVLLTVALIAIILYYHPSAGNVTYLFKTVPISPETQGLGRDTLVASFAPIEPQVVRAEMIAEVTCVSKPWTVIPMVVVRVQEQLVTRPGTILAFLEPLYEGGLDGVPRDSTCIANAYTSNHELLASKDIGFFRRIALHAVDAVGVVHAMNLRIQALVLSIKTLVFSRH